MFNCPVKNISLSYKNTIFVNIQTSINSVKFFEMSQHFFWSLTPFNNQWNIENSIYGLNFHFTTKILGILKVKNLPFFRVL